MSEIYRFKIFSKFRELKHIVTKRDEEKALDNSLALHTGEDTAQILKNREGIERFMDMDIVVADQIHGSNIEIIDESGSRGWRDRRSAVRDCDSLITDVRGVSVGVLTADCLPILIYDPINVVVGATHAGWRGTKERIIYKTIERMVENFGSNPRDIVVGIAPSIGGCCYEVDFNVAQHFLGYRGACRAKIGGKYMLNLVEVNIAQMVEIGVAMENIESSGICTHCDFHNFFSYRKTSCSGRFISLIGVQ
ncbi:MAG: peptidoglycan editing factor PgeF [Epsilonproteobacteria bacterium]|nr:peptidoglycan editing factor PgeF [Campylobacterota bacterium]